MAKKSIVPGRQPVYRSKLFEEEVHDSYKLRGKLREPTLCPDCGAVYTKGRWQWLPKPAPAHVQTCPACHRIKDKFPAGFVKLEGGFLAEHKAEILALVRHVEEREKAERPLQRVMDVADVPEGVLVTTTDIHLAHGIGEAVRHAYAGELESHYNREEKLLRVRWSRQR